MKKSNRADIGRVIYPYTEVLTKWLVLIVQRFQDLFLRIHMTFCGIENMPFLLHGPNLRWLFFSRLPPPRPEYLRRHTLPFVLRHQVNPLMPLHIHRQLLMLVLILAWPFDQMHMHHALSPRSLHIEPKPHVLGSPLVRLGGATDEAVARPARPR